jgi:hypothetical protein
LLYLPFANKNEVFITKQGDKDSENLGKQVLLVFLGPLGPLLLLPFANKNEVFITKQGTKLKYKQSNGGARPCKVEIVAKGKEALLLFLGTCCKVFL